MLAGGGVEVELMGPEFYLQYKVEQLDLDVKMLRCVNSALERGEID